MNLIERACHVYLYVTAVGRYVLDKLHSFHQWMFKIEEVNLGKVVIGGLDRVACTCIIVM